MIIRNSKFKQVIPDNFTYKGTKYTKAYAKGKQLFGYSEDDYKLQYFTIESLEDGNVITLTIGSGVTSTQMTSFSYSVDNGTTWNTTTVDSTTQTINVNLDKGEKVLWKGSGSATSTEGSLSSSSVFSSTKKLNVYGNIMSLLYDENFYSEKSLANKGVRTFELLFYGASNLVSAKDLSLPATTINTGCYLSMFQNCTSLIEAPKLPAITLTNNCYQSMFQNCTSLVIPPELPATTLNNYCYKNMFNGCTSLAVVPELPALTMTSECYREMFRGCTSLVEALDLPATIAANNCCYAMFMDCTLLVKAPALLITTLATGCYAHMFRNCTSLNYIKCLAADISATNCTQNWVSNVASTGTFIKADTMNDWVVDSVNGIPIGWTLHNYENCTVTLTVNDSSYGRVDGAGTYKTGELVTIKANAIDGYRFVGWYDGSTLVSENEAYTFKIWTDVSYQAVFESGQVDYSTQYFTIESLEDDNSITLAKVGNAPTVTFYYSVDNGSTWAEYATESTKEWVLNTGDKVLLKATADTLSTYYARDYWNIVGTKQHIAYGNIMSLIYGDSFASQTTLKAAHSFASLFKGDTKLVDAENLRLPATTCTSNCYAWMFYDCTSLKATPELPATTLESYCYTGMFEGCKSLTQAPTLPATTLAQGCYSHMFMFCRSLSTIPSLPATNLAWNCYEYMLASCTSLVTVTISSLPATTLAPGCYSGMFNSCRSIESIELPATTLARNCYQYMLTGCDRISSIKVYAETSGYQQNFGTSMPSSGTYYVKPNATANILNSCPTGWTISKTL